MPRSVEEILDNASRTCASGVEKDRLELAAQMCGFLAGEVRLLEQDVQRLQDAHQVKRSEPVDDT